MELRKSLFVLTVVLASISACATTKSTPSQFNAPNEEVAGDLYQAIWGDLKSNAFIGNGNELAWRWANAGNTQEEPPQLHIVDLRCREDKLSMPCKFELLRDGGVVIYEGKPAPDRLACRAVFRRADIDADWYLPRLPPRPNGGHSRITIECEPID